MTYRKISKIGYTVLGAALLLTAVFGWEVGHSQVPVSGLPAANLPLQSTNKIIVNQTISGAQSTRAAPLSALNPFFPSPTSHYILQAADPTLTQSRVLVGTANQVIITDGGALGNLTLSLPQSIAPASSPTFAGLTLTGPISGTSATFSGAISAGSLSLTTPLPATSGGTGFGSYTIGDLLQASSATALSKLSDVASGSYLRSGGVATTFAWSTLTLPNAATTGDLLMATGTNAIGSRADVAAGSYLRSAGVGVVPVYSTTTIPNTSVLGDIWYGSAANVVSALTGNITTTKQFLTQTGTGAVSAAPAWAAIAAGDLPGSFSGFANPTGTIGLTAVNGAATTAPRSDSAPALSQAIIPTWTGVHTFSASPNFNLGYSGTYNQNTVIQSVLSNTSTGVAADNAGGYSNGTNTILTGITGVNNVTAHWTGGPTTSHIYTGTIGNIPISTGVNGIEQQRLTSTAFTSRGPTAAAQVDLTPDKGSFTLTYTGFTATVQCTANWNRVGNIAFLNLCAATGTSNATTMTGTTLPAAIVPAIAQAGVVCGSLEDNGALSGGFFQINAASNTITFGKGIVGAVFTNTGTKGFLAPGCSISYMLNN